MLVPMYHICLTRVAEVSMNMFQSFTQYLHKDRVEARHTRMRARPMRSSKLNSNDNEGNEYARNECEGSEFGANATFTLPASTTVGFLCKGEKLKCEPCISIFTKLYILYLKYFDYHDLK